MHDLAPATGSLGGLAPASSGPDTRGRQQRTHDVSATLQVAARAPMGSRHEDSPRDHPSGADLPTLRSVVPHAGSGAAPGLDPIWMTERPRLTDSSCVSVYATDTQSGSARHQPSLRDRSRLAIQGSGQPIRPPPPILDTGSAGQAPPSGPLASVLAGPSVQPCPGAAAARPPGPRQIKPGSANSDHARSSPLPLADHVPEVRGLRSQNLPKNRDSVSHPGLVTRHSDRFCETRESLGSAVCPRLSSGCPVMAAPWGARSLMSTT